MAIRYPKVGFSRPIALNVFQSTKPRLKIPTMSHVQFTSRCWIPHTRFFTTQIISDQGSFVAPTQIHKKIKAYDEPSTKLLKITEKMTAAMKKKKYPQVWGQLNTLRYEKIQPTQYQYTLAIEAYAKVSKLDKVLVMFEEMKQTCGPTTRAYNALILCNGKSTHSFDEAKWKEILDILDEMKKQSIPLKTQTYEILMKLINPPYEVRSNTFPEEKRFEIAKALFDECGRQHIPYSPKIFTNLLIAYKKFGKWQEIANMYDILVKTGTRADLQCLSIFWQAFRTLGKQEMVATVERLRNDRIQTAQLNSKNLEPAAKKRATVLQKLWPDSQQPNPTSTNQFPPK